MTETKLYLAGLTPKCAGHGRICDRRVSRSDTNLCHFCSIEKNHDDFKAEFAKEPTDNKWYIKWSFDDDPTFVCRTCGARWSVKDVGIPEMGSNGEFTENLVHPAAGACRLAKEFWGQDCGFTHRRMMDYVHNVRTLSESRRSRCSGPARSRPDPGER